MQTLQDQLEGGGSLEEYEFEGTENGAAEVLQDLSEFHLASVSPVAAFAIDGSDGFAFPLVSSGICASCGRVRRCVKISFSRWVGVL